jgi:hypothetical protein
MEHCQRKEIMISANPNVTALHTAYCEVSGYELQMLPFFERGWLQAHLDGVTPDAVAAVWKQRQKGVHKGERRQASLLLRAFCGTEDAIASVVEEYAAIKAQGRVRLVDPARAEVLRTTGRSDAVPETPAKAAADLELIKRLREAAQ